MALDTKRSLSPIDGDSGAKKRKVLDTLTEEGPLTQEDVVYFQKEAIFRKLSLYRHELAIVKKSLQDWKLKCRLNADKLSLLNDWWLNTIDLLVSQGLVTVDEDSILKSREDVLFIVNELKNDGRIDDLLELRRKIISSIIEPIIKNTESKILPDISSKITSLLNDLSAERIKHNSLKQENQILKNTVEDLQSNLLNLVKENDRLTSKTLKRTDEALAEDTKAEENNDSAPATADVQPPSSVPNGTPNGISEKKPDAGANDEKLENLIIETNELRLNVEELSKQLKEESAKALSYKQQVSTYEIRLLNLTEDDLRSSIVYQNLVSKLEKLTNENSELSRKDSTLLDKLASIESNHVKYREEFESKLFEEKKLLQSQLEKTESDLTRVRANRDELIGKLEIIKADKRSKELYDELLRTIEGQKGEIKKLKSERQYDTTNTTLDGVDIGTLKKQNQALIIELKDIETAFNTTQQQLNKKFETAITNENLITKLKLEKNKADQKYFAAMRAKDSLNNELKTLKIQQARSNELISQLKDLEKVTQSKIKVLESNLENLKSINLEKTKEYDILKGKLLEMLKSLDNLKKKYDQLTNEKKVSVAKSHENEDHIKQLKKELESSKSRTSSLEKLLQKYRKKGDNVDFKEDDSRIEGLISIAKCSICSTRFKNTALKSCGHVFCAECVNDRLAARLRKCPSCNCAFSFNDLLSVHL